MPRTTFVEPVVIRRLRVPEITVFFWVLKGLSTAMGEAASDYLVRTLAPVPAVLLGFVAFAIAMAVQLRMRRYNAVTYWLAVAMVGVFGTMVADVLHVGFGVPYLVSSALFAVILAAIFLTWKRVEGTLSIHSIDTTRRELFYWATVIATFALGTAAGDFLAVVMGIGYLGSAVVFAVIILIPALGYRLLHLNSVVAFWFAYVVTRPLGASLADWLGKPVREGGIGVGSGPVALVLAVAIAALTAHLAVTRRDEQLRAVPTKDGV